MLPISLSSTFTSEVTIADMSVVMIVLAAEFCAPG
jgi:hypothetical protein